MGSILSCHALANDVKTVPNVGWMIMLSYEIPRYGRFEGSFACVLYGEGNVLSEKNKSKIYVCGQ